MTKKRYTARSVNKEGEVISETKKGVATKRRDYAKFTQDVYEDINQCIMDERPYSDVIDILQGYMSKLYGMRLPHFDFVIYMGIGKITDYAKSVKKDKQVKHWIGRNGDIIPYSDKIKPLDSRLIYGNSIQANLGLKMIRRGAVLPPNTRLEFIYLEDRSTDTMSEKVEDYGYFLENYKDLALTPDLDYFAKSLSGSTGGKQVAEQMIVAYPGQIMYHWGHPDKEFRRILTEFAGLAEVILGDRQKMILYKVNSCTKIEIRMSSEDPTGDIQSDIGWMEMGTRITVYIHTRDRSVNGDLLVSRRGNMAKCLAVLYLVSKFGCDWMKQEYCKGSMSLYDAAASHISKSIVDRVHKKYGTKKRTPRQPTQRGDNILAGKMRKCKAVVRTRVGDLKPLTKVDIIGKEKLLDPTDEETPSDYIRPETVSGYVYTITDGSVVHEGVLREQLLTYYHKGDKDIPLMASYHRAWRFVREELAECQEEEFGR